ncbi:MAG: HU family DNA-binding protein [Aggregatilineales bacterium]
MKKSDFVAEIAKKTGMSRAKADEAVNAILDTITETLKSGDKVTLTGFGSFEVRHRAARPGRDIRTKQKITIPASMRPVFSAGAVLKAAVSNKHDAKSTQKKK